MLLPFQDMTDDELFRAVDWNNVLLKVLLYNRLTMADKYIAMAKCGGTNSPNACKWVRLASSMKGPQRMTQTRMNG